MSSFAEPSARVAWITGAGSGMGRAAAVELARHGWRVALTGRRREALEQTAELASEAGGEALVVVADVTSDDLAPAASAVLQTWGRLDALVLAAGLNAPRRRWDDQSLDDVRAIVDTNLMGVVAVVDAALPALREASGVVVVVSSYSAWTFSPGAGVAYGASKTALSTVVRSLNAGEAAHGVRACHLCPGDVDTDFLGLRPNVPDAAARQVMLSPGDVAAAVRFVVDAPAHVRVDELVISPVSQV